MEPSPPVLDLEAFAASVEAVRDTAFVLVDRAGLVTSWNDGAAAMTGLDRAAALGRRLGDACPTNGNVLADPARLPRPDAADPPVRIEILRTPGARLAARATALPMGEGWLVRLQADPGTGYGVTPEALQSVLLPALRELVIITDLDGVVTYWNEAATALLGFPAEERVGHHLFAITPEHRRARMSALIASLAAGAEWDGEYEATHRDGSRVWVEARAWAIRDEAGRPRALVVLAHDIRQRKQAEQALAAREAAYRAAIETTGDGYWVVAPPDGIIVEVNHAYARFSGYSREELLQMHVSDLEAVESQDHVEARIARLSLAGHDRFETYHRRKDGSLWPVEITASVARDSGLFYVFARDITERRRAEEALRSSEARLANAQQAARLGSWEWDPKTGEVWWSDAIRSMFGLGPGDHASVDAFLGALHPDDRPRALERIQAVLQGSDGFADDLRVVGPDGAIMWIDSRGRVIRDEAGAIVRVEGTDHDITDRKRAEEALRESEARFRSVLDGSPAVIYLKDFQGRYLFVNETLAAIVGRPASEFVGLRAHDLFPAEVADEFDRNDGVVRATLRPHQLEESAVLPDGRAVTFLSVQFPLFREDGTPYAVCGISTDITDRKRAQAERDRLWNLSPDPLCVFDFQGNFTQVNPAWTERLGWSEAELLARPGQELMHPEDLAGALLALERVSHGERVRNFETRVSTKSGEWRWFSWNAQPMPDRQLAHAFVRDVTEEKRLDEQMRQSQKIEAIGRLAGGVAHDFNNLLTVINGYAALLLDSAALQPTQRDPLLAIRDAGDRAAALTAQLLAFGRKAMVEPKVLDLNEVAAASTRMLGRLIGEDVRLMTDLAADGPRVLIDPSQLDQVLVNLVVNARDAMPRGGLLRISTSLTQIEPTVGQAADLPPGTYVRLTVSDTGAGIADDVRAHIFEPFYTTKGLGQGTGLGLATVYGIVRQAGGTVTVESEPGHGSAFHVLLPAVRPEEEVAEPADAQPVAPEGHECVLIVEDEPGVRHLTRVLLESQGYTVHEAASARQALTVAEMLGDAIDLLITDVVMPGMSGHQLALALRDQRPGLRVLFMSGYTDDAVLRHGVESSVDAFLQKPFTPVALARRVRAVLDGRPDHGPHGQGSPTSA